MTPTRLRISITLPPPLRQEPSHPPSHPHYSCAFLLQSFWREAKGPEARGNWKECLSSCH